MLLVRIFKAFHFNVDVNLFNNLPCHSDLHSYAYPTRRGSDLIVPRLSRCKTRMWLNYVAPKIWNEITHDLKNNG